MGKAHSEKKRDFIAEARTRLDEMDRNAMGVPWDEVRRYVLARAVGKRVARPKARKSGV